MLFWCVKWSVLARGLLYNSIRAIGFFSGWSLFERPQWELICFVGVLVLIYVDCYGPLGGLDKPCGFWRSKRLGLDYVWFVRVCKFFPVYGPACFDMAAAVYWSLEGKVGTFDNLGHVLSPTVRWHEFDGPDYSSRDFSLGLSLSGSFLCVEFWRPSSLTLSSSVISLLFSCELYSLCWKLCHHVTHPVFC